MIARTRHAVLLAALAIAGTLLALGPVIDARGAAATRCMGAAARDRARPCSNPTKSMVPSFAVHDHYATPRCTALPHPRQPNLNVCVSGAPASQATQTVAILGDSHAIQWQPALSVAARSAHWRAIAITRSLCFFSAAVDRLLPGARGTCVDWYREVREWFLDHPEVHTVLVSQRATTPVALHRGETYFGVKSSGFARAWAGLPPSVRHVVVIHDVPETSNAMFDCVRDVLAAGKERPGPACTLARSKAIRWDTAVSTVHQLHSPRYQTVDLTDYFCGPRTCPLVIGGVLSHRDVDHMTGWYSATLGPYLLRRLRRLMRSW